MSLFKDRRLSWESTGADWPNREASRFVEAGGICWHVQVMGPEDAPVVLLLHGTGASTHSFRDLMPLLAKEYRVIAPDLPGQGFSETPGRNGLTLWGMGSLIANLLDALGAKPAVVAGHSAGGAIAIQMALAGQVEPERIVAINAALEPFPGSSFFSPMAKLLFMNPFVPRLFSFRARLSDIAGFVESSTNSQIDDVGKRCYEKLLQSPDHVGGALGMMANWDLGSLQTRLRHLKVPLVLVIARNDATVSPEVSERAAKKAPNATLIAFETGGHLLHEVNPEAVAEIIAGRQIDA